MQVVQGINGVPDAVRIDFDVLIDRHSRTIYNVLLLLVGRIDVAANLTVASFGQASHEVANALSHSGIRVWLYSIVASQFETWSQGQAGNPTAARYSNDIQQATADAIAQLPRHLRLVIALRDIAGLDYAGIADVIGTPPMEARSRVVAARSLIHRCISRHLPPLAIDPDDRRIPVLSAAAA